MEKRKPNDLPPEQCLAVDTDTLCKLLCCGRHTAVQIGESCQCTHYHEHPCPMECPAYQRISL